MVSGPASRIVTKHDDTLRSIGVLPRLITQSSSVLKCAIIIKIMMMMTMMTMMMITIKIIITDHILRRSLSIK